MARDPGDSTTPATWHIATIALVGGLATTAGSLFMGYVVGPAIGHLLHHIYVTVGQAVDDNLADLGD